MSVSIINQPTTPNVTGTNLMYTVVSTNATASQFQYITDIYESGSDTLLSRFYSYPNTYGYGVIDVARPLDDRLGYDDFWKITGSASPVNAVKTFDIRFGESYGTSLSSSVAIYTSSTPNYLEVFPGTIYPNEGTYNFVTSSFVDATRSQYLTNQPNFATNPTTYQYAPFLNKDNYLTVTQFQDPTNYIIVRGLNYSGTTFSSVTQSIFTFTGGGEFSTIGLGPQNLSDWDSGWANYFASGSINYVSTTSDFGSVRYWVKDNLGSITNTPSGPVPCLDQGVYFAFVNKYGFYDYYPVYHPVRRSTDVGRNNYEQENVNYSTTNSVYNITRRGTKQYLTSYKDTFKVSTDYIDKNMAQWLTEMLNSGYVYIQENGNFVPVTITNSSYITNMNTSRQKLFKYDIEYKYANPRPER